ncbi:MAG: glycoside hydrolase family 3 C-terminal domain-containing protein, partial [Anaerolineales bacterium]|nr:glycoside hydrolase family 3 C-terminal domain-containing protein [Anaerolineales bacterium]
PEYRQTALEVARQAMVLLKNQGGVLPVDLGKVRKLALIGPLADDHHEILGTWYRIGRDEDSESVLDGLRASLPASVNLRYVKGCELEAPGQDGFEEAIAAARQSDLAVLVLGEGEYMSGEAHSRAFLSLPGEQQALLEAVYATGTPVIVVLMCGRPLVIPWLAEQIPAILCAWHSGIRTGQAVADLLLGVANPSAKLTASWPRAEGQIPVYYNAKSTGRPAEGEGTYQFDKRHRAKFLDLDHRPLYPFGFGLSYTEIEYTDLEIEQPQLGAVDTLEVHVTLHNRGPRAGAEIIQLYVRDLVRSITPPVKELKAFDKVYLEAGESRRVTLQVPVERLGFHDLHLQYRVETGEFELWVGPNSAEGLQAEFVVNPIQPR